MTSRGLPKLIFGENAGKAFSDVGEFYDFIRQNNPAVLSAATHKPGFSFKGSVIAFPGLKISTSASDPCTIKTQFSSNRFSLIVPLVGHGTIGAPPHQQEWNAQDHLILNALNEDNVFTFRDLRSQVLFEIDADRLIQTFAHMYGTDANHSVISADSTVVEAVGEPTKRLRSLLLSTLALVDMTGHDERHLARIGLDDVLIRIIAEMTLEGKASRLAVRGYPRAKRSQRGMHLVCELIRQSKGKPLSSTQMEAASGMTNRSLNYAFHDAYDCSPQEWQRNYFLDQARAEMLHPDNTSSVKAIAYEYGFATSRSFATFYHRRFGERPSETLGRLSTKPVK